MAVVFLLLGFALIGAAALVFAGRLPDVPQPTIDEITTSLPEPPTSADIATLRFPVVARGYRMVDVDAALEVLRARIAELEGVEPSPFPTQVVPPLAEGAGQPADAAPGPQGPWPPADPDSP